MRFHAHSDLTKLEEGVEYAGIYVDSWLMPFRDCIRPVKVTVAFGGEFEFPMIEDPTHDPSTATVEAGGPELQIVGRWDGTVYQLTPWPDPAPSLSELARKGMTWQGYAAQQLGQVLRHNELAERLSDFGIAREPEQYLPHKNTANAVQRSLVLTYDELDQLLRAGGI